MTEDHGLQLSLPLSSHSSPHIDFSSYTFFFVRSLVGDQTDNFALARQLKEKGAFETAVMAMEAFPDELELQENAALFFLSLTKFHHEFMIKEAVLASGAAEAIKKAHRHFPESQQLTIINRELTELTKPCCIS